MTANLNTCRRFQNLTSAHSPAEERLPALAAWKSMSLEDVELCRQALGQTFGVQLSRHFGKVLLAIFGVVAGTVMLSLGVLDGDYPNETLAIVVGLITGIVFTVLSGFIIDIIADGGSNALLEGLTPASKLPFLCGSALEILMKHSELQTFRDDLISRGRELTWLDLNYIHQRGGQLAHEAFLHEQQRSCRQLHGIEPVPIAAKAH